nr:hypothetical protein [Microbacterium sp. 11MF]
MQVHTVRFARVPHDPDRLVQGDFLPFADLDSPCLVVREANLRTVSDLDEDVVAPTEVVAAIVERGADDPRSWSDDLL